MRMRPASFDERFRLSAHDDQGCRIWSGCLSRDGYARHSGRGAHLAAYERFVGPIPEGMTIDHTCFNPRCVEPTHLRLLSHLQNVRNKRDRAVLVPDNECINGHPYDVANTYIRPNGRRDCRACIRARVAAYKARRLAAAPT